MFAATSSERKCYSVPTCCVVQMVWAEVYAARLELYWREQQVVVHPHAAVRGQPVLRLEHFLGALVRKHYAVAHAAVVRDGCLILTRSCGGGSRSEIPAGSTLVPGGPTVPVGDPHRYDVLLGVGV